MIRAIGNLGLYSLKEKGEDPLNNLLDDAVVDYVLLIKLNDRVEIQYEGIDIEEYDSNNKSRYLYKKGSPRGGDITPSSVYLKDIKNPNKSLSRYLLSLSKIENDFFKKLNEYFKVEENKKKLFEEIEEKIENKKKYLLSIKIGEKYLRDIEEVRNLIDKNKGEKFSRRESFSSEEKISRSEIPKKCYLCGEEKIVNGFTNTFQFYTLDKKGFMTGGFNRKYAWRNYPVCDECGELLEIGKKFLKEEFRDTFGGLTYFIIPNFILDINIGENFNEYRKIIEKLTSKNLKKISLADDKREGIMKGEKKILKLASEMNNNFSVNIMFYKEQNAEFKILQNIEEVLPSRLKFLLDNKDEIEDTDKYEEFSPIGGKYNLRINFFNLKKFFKSEKLFLECMNDIYINKKIDKDFITKIFIETIREKYIEEKEILSTVLESFMWYKFLIKINVLKNFSEGDEKCMIEESKENKIYLDFLLKHTEVLNTDVKKAIFLEGVLVGKLLKLQEQKLKPFYSRLNGLKLNEKLIKRILAEAINKLNEYDKNYYNNLEKLISEYLLMSNFEHITNDEISYYFVLGMNLVDEFKNNIAEKEEEK